LTRRLTRITDGVWAPRQTDRKEAVVIVLGVILLILGLLFGVPVLWTIGVILAIIGAVVWVAEGAGASWGRRWY